MYKSIASRHPNHRRSISSGSICKVPLGLPGMRTELKVSFAQKDLTSALMEVRNVEAAVLLSRTGTFVISIEPIMP